MQFFRLVVSCQVLLRAASAAKPAVRRELFTSNHTDWKLTQETELSRPNELHKDLHHRSRVIQNNFSRGVAALEKLALSAEGWKLLQKSINGDAGTVDLSRFSGDLAKAGGKIMITWSTGSMPANAKIPSSYEKAVEFKVPGAVSAKPRLAAGQMCTNGLYYSQVDVKCVRGACDMPAKMYTGRGFNRICYDKAYGLVANSGNPQCDWGMDGQPFKALYLGSGDGCHGMKGQSGARQQLSAIAIWVKEPTPPLTPEQDETYKAGISKLDKDGDGCMSAAEAKDGGLDDEQFKQLDTNSDGKACKEDYAADTKSDPWKEFLAESGAERRVRVTRAVTLMVISSLASTFL